MVLVLELSGRARGVIDVRWCNLTVLLRTVRVRVEVCGNPKWCKVFGELVAKEGYCGVILRVLGFGIRGVGYGVMWKGVLVDVGGGGDCEKP